MTIPLNVLFPEKEEEKKQKHWCLTEAMVAFVTQTQKRKKNIYAKIYFINNLKMYNEDI